MMTKLSPAQRKVLEIMAEGVTLSRTGGWFHWNWASKPFSKPTTPTIHTLEKLGLLEVKGDGALTRTWSITDKGQEALK